MGYSRKETRLSTISNRSIFSQSKSQSTINHRLIVRSGNSSLAVDMLLATMKQIGREDLVEIISREKEHNIPLPAVFY